MWTGESHTTLDVPAYIRRTDRTPMKLPPALLPLRNRMFRLLWTANVVVWLGTWLQNTGAGWLMTTLDPRPVVVAMVQAATILPVFLLALPGGALADIVDRRTFLIVTQAMTMVAAGALAVLTVLHLTTASTLLGFTFLIGVGSALTAPAWSASVPELVPRWDLVQAVALNGIGFNLARAVGPALAGFLVALAGSGLAFSLFALTFPAMIGVLLIWRRRPHSSGLPPEHLISAMRAGMRFVRNTPAMQNAMLRAFTYSIPAAAPWALLPLVVRTQLHLGASMYGVILGLMGVGGVTSGMLLPQLRGRFSRSVIVLGSSLCSCAGVVVLALSRHWVPAAGGMLLFGLGWVAAYSTMQAAAQLSAPPWVRARSLAIYQLGQNGALTIGSFGWGWLGDMIGLSPALLVAGLSGGALALLVRGFSLDHQALAPLRGAAPVPEPEAPAPELMPILRSASARVMEMVQYRVRSDEREPYLEVMEEVRLVRGRCGALLWQLYEDVAHPEGWLEVWSVENWTDHLREVTRLSAEDRAALARVAVFQRDGTPPGRYLAVDPPHHVRG
jgi:MFS family permease